MFQWRQRVYSIMLQSNQQTLSRIQAIISGIHMINLHIFNHLNEHANRNTFKQSQVNQKIYQNFKKLNIAYFEDHMKNIQYLIVKSVKDVTKAKLVIPPLAYRPLRQQVHQDDFLRFQNQEYGVKFVIVDLGKECLLMIQSYKKDQGMRHSGMAMRKLDMYFLVDLAQRHPDGLLSQKQLEEQGSNFLQEVTRVFSGAVKCKICREYLAFNNQLLMFLPPTVRECVEGKEGRMEKVYYHQSCL